MIDRKSVDEQQFEEITAFLMLMYPTGAEFPKLITTLGYIAQTMQTVVDKEPQLFTDADLINHTGVTH